MTLDTIRLLFTANQMENTAIIEQKLADGHDVVTDRYWPSAIAYTYGAQDINKIHPTVMRLLEDVSGVMPDLFVLLLPDPFIAAERARARTGAEGEKQNAKTWADAETQAKVAEIFKRRFMDQRYAPVFCVDTTSISIDMMCRETSVRIKRVLKETK